MTYYRYDRRVATRPIDIDKEAIVEFIEGDLVPSIMRWLARRPDRDAPIGSVHEVARGQFEFRDVQRERLEFEVIVDSKPSRAKGVAVLAGLMNAKAKEIHLTLNGALSANDFLVPTKWTNRLSPIHSCSHVTCLPFGLYSIMIHELTHASESAFLHKLHYSPSEVREKGEAAFGPYLNDPSEVRANMQQIVDEAIRNAGHQSIRDHAQGKPDPNQSLVNLALQLSTTYGIVEKHLQPRNKNLILKAVYQAFEREGLLFGEGEA